MSKNTIRIVFNILFFSLICAAPSDARPTADPAVTYIANEGFLIECGGASVLVDAIFTESWGTYATPLPEVLAAMRGAEGPFAKIKLVLITHSHPDHFRVDYVLEFMQHNERAALIAPGDATAATAGECKAFIPETGVDIAFIPWWVLADWEQGQALLGRVRPQQVVYFTHTPLTDIGRVKSLTMSRRASLPLTVVPEKQMETVWFRDTGR